ncbi:hypothetical protein [Kordia sp.]|uniref:hypothetical protein n=1 Tax=Kordia sp. TaxID=1965332 RepID=UPI003D6A2BA3
MKLYYILLFVSTFAFGQINTEKLAGNTWYKISSSDGIIVYSVFKKQQQRSFQFTLNKDHSFSIPHSTRPRRCANNNIRNGNNIKTRNNVNTRNRKATKEIEKGTWSVEIIDGDSILILDSTRRHMRYKILYASSSTLELQKYR